MSIGHHPSVRVYHSNSVKVEKMYIRRAAISAIHQRQTTLHLRKIRAV
jgi:hypothetical protein